METLLSGSNKATTSRWPGTHAELVIVDTKGPHVQEPAFTAAMIFANVEVHFTKYSPLFISGRRRAARISLPVRLH